MRAFRLAVCLLVLLSPPAFADFVNVATGPLAGSDNTFGVAWGDYDNDGDQDLFLANAAATNKLFRNDGGILRDVTPAVLADSPSALCAAWGDYDRDGDLDLAVGKDGPNRLFRNQGNNVWVNVSAGPILTAEATETVTWVDFDLDNDVDLFFVNQTGNDQLLRNDNGTFVELSDSALSDPAEGRGAAWGDYDNDGDQDVIVGNFQGLQLYRNNRAAGFQNQTTPVIDLVGAAGVDWGDFNNDGRLDFYVARDIVHNKLIRNDGPIPGSPGAWGWYSLTSIPIRDDAASQSCAWADYDLDGDLDLFVGNADSTNRLFRNEGFEDWVNVAPAGIANAGSARGAAWADYDGDGDLDLYIGVFGGPNKLFRNDLLTNNRWLELDLRGGTSNYFAVGAVVRVWAAGTMQMRHVQAGGGLGSMNSLTVEFGFPNTVTELDSMEIRWPSGTVDAYHDYAVNVRRVITEGVSLATGDPGLPAGFALLPASPNPFRASTMIHYQIAEAGPMSLQVFDTAGRLVRVLESDPAKPAGRYEVMWDGRTGSGRRAASGIYFYRLDVRATHEVQKITLLR